MTLETLQNLALRLGNSCFVRWWGHWNHPFRPVRMALYVVDLFPNANLDRLDGELAALGMEREELPRLWLPAELAAQRFYTVTRQDDAPARTGGGR